MEWYKYCPDCNKEGRIRGIDNVNFLYSFICDSCSYGWEVEIQCDSHIKDHYGNDLCSVDSSVGECRGNLCQRLEKIKFFHLGDTRKHGSEQIHDDLKTSHQTREKSRTF
jgi:hypothetical protein